MQGRSTDDLVYEKQQRDNPGRDYVQSVLNMPIIPVENAQRMLEKVSKNDIRKARDERKAVDRTLREREH